MQRFCWMFLSTRHSTTVFLPRRDKRFEQVCGFLSIYPRSKARSKTWRTRNKIMLMRLGLNDLPSISSAPMGNDRCHRKVFKWPVKWSRCSGRISLRAMSPRNGKTLGIKISLRYSCAVFSRTLVLICASQSFSAY